MTTSVFARFGKSSGKMEKSQKFYSMAFEKIANVLAKCFEWDPFQHSPFTTSLLVAVFSACRVANRERTPPLPRHLATLPAESSLNFADSTQNTEGSFKLWLGRSSCFFGTLFSASTL